MGRLNRGSTTCVCSRDGVRKVESSFLSRPDNTRHDNAITGIVTAGNMGTHTHTQVGWMLVQELPSASGIDSVCIVVEVGVHEHVLRRKLPIAAPPAVVLSALCSFLFPLPRQANNRERSGQASSPRPSCHAPTLIGCPARQWVNGGVEVGYNGGCGAPSFRVQGW